MDLTIRTMTPGDAARVSALADRLVGSAYYTPQLVAETLARTTTERGVFSYVAESGDALVAFRFVMPPGRWEAGRGRGLSPGRWGVPLSETAYFQSCFVDDGFMGQGLGRRLGVRALMELKAHGAQAVVAHSWKESPHGSSLRYLRRLGFEAVTEHPRYWSEIDYVCRLDGKPCLCTAIEMILVLGPWEAPP